MEQLLNTINGTFERCQRENIGISKNLLRSLVKSNTLPHVKVGNNQVLINFSVLQNFLITGTVQPPEPKVNGGIKPVPESLMSVR